MNPFEHQFEGPPCSGDVRFMGGTAGLSIERRQEIREDYKSHIGQWKLNYLLRENITDEVDKLTVYGYLSKLWSEDVEVFLEENSFVGYLFDDKRFPIFEAK